MTLQAGPLLLVLFGCLLFPNTIAQSLNDAWTLAYNISVGDPDEVLAQANQVIGAVRNLTEQINNLTANLTFVNATDYEQLQSLLSDINDLAGNITDIDAQYNATMKQINSMNMNPTLQQINETLFCFSQANCVTGGPTTTAFTGSTTIDLCDPNPCQNGASCNIVNSTFVCKCEGCYLGHVCEYDPCTVENSSCENEGECVYDTKTCSTTCKCKNGTIGHFCEDADPCTDGPCKNGATCKPVNGTHYHCSCPPCYGGTLCDEDPCADTGDFCGDHGVCVFNVSGVCTSVRCRCDYGWDGYNCQTQVPTSPVTGTTKVPSTTTIVDPCLFITCQNGGTCTSHGDAYTCQCVPPYTGTLCDSAMCSPDPAQILNALNGTWQTFSTTRFPSSIHESNCLWRIRASPGQTVAIIVNNVTFEGGQDGNFQILDPAANNASLFQTHATVSAAVHVNTTSQALASVLFDTGGSASGSFSLQYQGVYTNPCDGYNGCGPNGVCEPNGDVPECKCNPCYNGPTCGIQKPDPCANNRCGQHGHCIYNNETCSNPSCVCDSGYTGPFCSSPRYNFEHRNVLDTDE